MQNTKRHREGDDQSRRKRRRNPDSLDTECPTNWLAKSQPPRPGSINSKLFPGWIEDHIDVSKFTCLEIHADQHDFFDLVLQYGSESCNVSTFIPRSFKQEDEESGISKKKTKLVLGHGLHEGSYKGKRLIIGRFKVGEPVGTGRGIAHKDLLVLFLEGSNQQDALREFLDELLERNRMDPPADKFQVYRWNICGSYWYCESYQNARTLDSVVLPSELKADIISDFEQFLNEKTRDWYHKHGIPYKRSYIFYGPPGTGKTSFIQALAGAYRRHVCFLQPNDPRFTDDVFKTCLQEAPDNSIIVLEDIDALFNSRTSMNRSCPLTFTGLLNGLDGIGNAIGQLFVLSTNHLERLDPALIRSGRVDRKFEFSYCTHEALQLMFQKFYPGSAVAKDFADVVRSKTKEITAADLQQAFIANMYNTDVQCVEYMKKQFDLSRQKQLEKEEEEAFKELDRRLKKERKLLELKRQREKKAEQEALEKEVEEELKAKVEDADEDSAPVELSGSESS